MSEEPNSKPSSFRLLIQKVDRGLGLSRSFAVAAAAASLLAAISAVVQDRATKPVMVALGIDDFQRIERQVAVLNEKTGTLEQRATTAAGPPKALTTSEFALLREKQEALSKRLQALESVILVSPAKALEVPMLRRDIDSNKQASVDSISAIQHSVDRVYDQNKYVMITIAVSIVLLAISSFVKPNK